MLTLLDSLGGRVTSTVSDVSGTFLLAGAHAGTYRIEAERIGYRTILSDPLRLGAGDTIRHELTVPVEAVSLEGVAITGERQCRLRPEEGLELSRVWDEARKALTGVAWTREEGYVYEVETWGRELNTRMLLQRELDRAQQVFVGSTFASLPASTLLDEGFVRETDEGFRYYGPDASVLLSDRFLDTHCFRLAQGAGDARGLLGLAFEPISDEGPVDIRGVLWLDPATARLRWVEYSYARLDVEVDRSQLGGRIVFDQLPGGSWIVREWRIRGPILHRTHDRDEITGQRIRLGGILEEGARTIRIWDRDGTLVLHAQSGTVSGLVLDSLHSEPVAGARVEIMGTGRMARTGAEGRFQFSNVAEGRYRFRMTHPRLDSMGIGPVVEEDEVRTGTLTALRFRMPSRSEALARRCEQEGAGGGVVVVGAVRDSLTGEGIPGVTAEASWAADAAEPDTFAAGPATTRTATTGPDGAFVLCDVPRGTRIALSARALADASVSTTVSTAGADRVHRVELRLPLTTEIEPARVFGLVTEHQTGRPVEGAEIRLGDEGAAAVSGSTGFFSMDDVEPGAYVLRVDHLGYGSQERAVRVGPGSTVRLEVALAAEAIELEGIEVSVESRGFSARMAGLHERMERGAGEFILRDEIEQRGNPPVTSLLDGRAGLDLELVGRETGTYVPVFRRGRSLSGTCQATVYVNGHRIRDQFIRLDGIDFIPGIEIEAIEIYRGPAQLPGEFGGSHAQCGVVALWTR